MKSFDCQEQPLMQVKIAIGIRETFRNGGV